MHKIITLETRIYAGSLKDGGCGRCQTSCQSACKTSCGIANQKCEATRAARTPGEQTDLRQDARQAKHA